MQPFPALNDEEFQLMTDVMSFVGRLVNQKPQLIKMTENQKTMIKNIGELADNIKKQQEEVIRNN